MRTSILQAKVPSPELMDLQLSHNNCENRANQNVAVISL